MLLLLLLLLLLLPPFLWAAPQSRSPSTALPALSAAVSLVLHALISPPSRPLCIVTAGLLQPRPKPRSLRQQLLLLQLRRRHPLLAGWRRSSAAAC